MRGTLLGIAITIVFTAANVYLGLRTGMTFASSIPAAIISMSALRLFHGNAILENNIVQTQASAAGTLCNIILVLPALVIVQTWHQIDVTQTFIMCLLGGLLGVAFSVPLRRVLVLDSALPFPEGVAAAEVLRTGHDPNSNPGGLRALAFGAAGSATLAALTSATKLLPESVSVGVTAGRAAFKMGGSISLALIGVGYLVRLGPCLALLFGAGLAWLVAVPC